MTDVRKVINGLAVFVEQELSMNLLEVGTVFLFCNRQRGIGTCQHRFRQFMSQFRHAA